MVMKIEEIPFQIKELDSMKKYPKELFFLGTSSLLQRKKISIVGSRKPNQYARHKTQELAQNSQTPMFALLAEELSALTQ